MHVRHTLTAFGFIFAAVVSIPASAQIESTPIPTSPKPDFSSMSFFVGTWACSTKSSRRPAAYVTTETYAMDSSGYWIEATSVISPTSWNPTKLTINDKITYDSDTKRWVDVLYGDQGAFGLTFSKGWNGNKLVWHDASFAPGASISSQSDVVMTKVSPTKTVSNFSFTESKTGRKISIVETCTKS